MKKTFVSPNLKVVKVKPANIICSSIETCTNDGIPAAKEGFSDDLDLGLNLNDYKD